jgi:hypothetical protein
MLRGGSFIAEWEARRGGLHGYMASGLLVMTWIEIYPFIRYWS